MSKNKFLNQSFTILKQDLILRYFNNAPFAFNLIFKIKEDNLIVIFSTCSSKK